MEPAESLDELRRRAVKLNVAGGVKGVQEPGPNRDRWG